ncbi:hypothetical protein MTO96_033210 [Rhipicephalus appendiculatus]
MTQTQDWAPSQHLGYRFGTAPSVKSTARYERAKARLSKKRPPQQRTQLAVSQPGLTIVCLKWSMQTMIPGKRRLLNVRAMQTRPSVKRPFQAQMLLCKQMSPWRA